MTKIVSLSIGQLSGVEGQYSTIYKGVPFAAPPVGELRWKEPQPQQPWEGVFEADTFGAKAIQVPHEPGAFYAKEFDNKGEFDVPMSEDCLYLNIWVPKEGDGPFPVAIWFHGGAFVGGHASEMEFDGEAYAKRGIILVTANYRLGMLGYFCHPELTKRDGHSGNYGALDQVAAINWVNEHISAFGGDAGNITIFGQSAGGMSVRALISSPLTKGKVHKAIMQSSSGYKSPIKIGASAKLLEKCSEKVLKREKLTLDDLYKMEPQSLVKIKDKISKAALLRGLVILSMAPVADGYFLEADCDTVAARKKALSIPYMIGCTKDDMMKGKKNPNMEIMYSTSKKWCHLQNGFGNPSYMYYFTRKMPGDKSGAFHAADLWYMFGTVDRCWRPLTEADKALSEEMLDAWASFIKTGDPGWKPCTKADSYVKVFDIK